MTTPSGIPIRSLQYWGAVSGSVNQRGSTADVWAAIQSAAAANGQTTPGLSLRDFNTLRSAAVGVRTAGAAFANAPGGSAVTAEQIAAAPWARSLAEQNALPMFQVRFNHITVNDEGEETAGYKTVTFTGQLPPTNDELVEQVDRDAQALADKYNSQHVGITDLTVFAI